MMPYLVGLDPDTNEIIVGDRRTNEFFLRGARSSEREIRDLIQAANQRIHAAIPSTEEVTAIAKTTANPDNESVRT